MAAIIYKATDKSSSYFLFSNGYNLVLYPSSSEPKIITTEHILNSPVNLRIVSGGQTGVDRAALDAAMELGIEHGGWCPRGRRAEDGVLPKRYNLCETESRKYQVRTEKNVLDSDATLLLYCKEITGGTSLTQSLAGRHGKPCYVVDLESHPCPKETALKMSLPEMAKYKLFENDKAIVNIAGPRESTSPGVYLKAKLFVLAWIGVWHEMS